jgi:hypothetical protein
MFFIIIIVLDIYIFKRVGKYFKKFLFVVFFNQNAVKMHY